MTPELTAKIELTAERGLEITTAPGTNAPGTADLIMQRGQDWSLKVTWYAPAGSVVDLSSGYTAALTIYDEPGGTAVVSLTQASGLTLAATAPNITAAISQATVDAYTWGPRAVFRLAVTTGGVATVLCGGVVVWRG